MNTTKLYPPLLESSIPAFAGMIKIPFSHNALVGAGDYKGFQIQIKEINGNVIYDGPVDYEPGSPTIIELNTSLIKSEISNNATWYKFQIAYIDNNNNIGYFSSASVGKYLGKITEDNFKVELKNNYENGNEIITGSYIHTNDQSEKEYSYRFILKDSNYNVLVDTGEVLHNINLSDDTDTSSIDKFKCNYCLTANLKYTLEYKIITINNYELSTSIDLRGNYFDDGLNAIPFTIKAILDRDRGSVNVIAKARISEEDYSPEQEPNRKIVDSNQLITGTFILRRTCSKDNFFKIFNIKTFCLLNTPLNSLTGGILLYKDFTVESGYSYRYYLQQVSKNGKVYSQVKSAMYKNQDIGVSFDDCFLYDGERQLNIKFNPKINSFKTNIQGTKTETIGSKYPFISYNAIINYKEFPISGLISYNMDEGEDFIKGLFAQNKMRGELSALSNQEPLTLVKPHLHNYIKQYDYDYNVTDLTDRNILLEKKFKLSVLDFLNDKKPKLFRSPTEGNYVVATMNVSLSPVDTLGRMLHNFSCTAYEIMDVDEFIETTIEKTAMNYLLSDEIWSRGKEAESNFRTFTAEAKDTNYNLMNYREYAKEVHIREAKPMSVVTLGIITLPDYSNITYIPITIGSTGSYNYRCFTDKEYIASIQLGNREKNYEKKPDFCNFILYRCLKIVENLFDNIVNVETTWYTKEINNRKDKPISLISNFYTPPTNNSEARVRVFTKIHLLKVRNFDIFHSQEVKYYIGDLYDIIQELIILQEKGPQRIEGQQLTIACSAGLEPYLSSNSNIFINRAELKAKPVNIIKEYENTYKDSLKYYLKYTFELDSSITQPMFHRIIEKIKIDLQDLINNSMQKFILLPQETKDIYLNYSVPLNLNFEEGSITFAPMNIIIYPTNENIYYDIFADYSDIYFLEGEQVNYR